MATTNSKVAFRTTILVQNDYYDENLSELLYFIQHMPNVLKEFNVLLHKMQLHSLSVLFSLLTRWARWVR
ncbi:MAG: hypothetical protein K0Q73_6887 [Paenibacillus sp.]|jgi:hypothetical protein|nr:hypothetical protein [Paenibacillus sp.]